MSSNVPSNSNHSIIPWYLATYLVSHLITRDISCNLLHRTVVTPRVVTPWAWHHQAHFQESTRAGLPLGLHTHGSQFYPRLVLNYVYQSSQDHATVGDILGNDIHFNTENFHFSEPKMKHHVPCFFMHFEHHQILHSPSSCFGGRGN